MSNFSISVLLLGYWVKTFILLKKGIFWQYYFIFFFLMLSLEATTSVWVSFFRRKLQLYSRVYYDSIKNTNTLQKFYFISPNAALGCSVAGHTGLTVIQQVIDSQHVSDRVFMQEQLNSSITKHKIQFSVHKNFIENYVFISRIPF